MDFLNIQNWCERKTGLIYTALIKSSAGKIGRGAVINPPFRSGNIKQFFLGENSCVSPYGWIECVKSYAGVEYEPKLEIGEDSCIGRFVHIIACGHMKIGRNVVIAERVYISDNLHGFERIDKPVMPQALKHPGPVTIEDEVWIGDGVCILPNVTIGKHSVIGSNSVVTKDIPAFSVAVGVPAKVIKKYNPNMESWEVVAT